MEWERYINRRLFLKGAGVSVVAVGAAVLPKPLRVFPEMVVNEIGPSDTINTEKSVKLMILTYHRVAASTILVGDFRRCRQRGWEAVSSSDIGLFMSGEGELPE